MWVVLMVSAALGRQEVEAGTYLEDAVNKI